MTHLRTLDLSDQETYDWLDRIGLELGDGDRQLALQTLRAVLHALRGELSIQQSAHLAAQFPTFIRGLYFEQWAPTAPAPTRSLDDFLARIDAFRPGYEDRCTAEVAARAIFAVLEESLSGGAEKIKQSLPKSIRALWD
jgi:uncharacterized protein (DUF2267 family)